MKMKSLHQNARKVNYYVRMFTKELLDEIDYVIKNSTESSSSSDAVPRRLTKFVEPSDNLSSFVDQLKAIHLEKDDDVLHSQLSQFISTVSNASLSDLWKAELSRCVRFKVPDDKVPWSTKYPDYQPVLFTAWPVLHTSLDPNSPKPPWADEDFTLKSKDELKSVKFNKDDELNGKKIDRKSRECKYELDSKTGLPRNPRGRTGMIGRGLLGRFGPNLAADPIVSRFKKLPDGSIKHINKKPVLECVFVQRRDNNEWAIPGGMVEPGTAVSLTLVKEFREEALNVCHNDKEKAEKMTNELKQTLFSKGFTIYEGYVDDPRNTDNAWMETVAKNFHDATGITYTFQLEGGDDAFNSKWQECSSSLKLYASHKHFIEKTVQKHSAHW